MSGAWTLLPRVEGLHPPALAPGYKTTIARSPRLAAVPLAAGPSELTGPRFAPAELGSHDADLIVNFAKDGLPIGERIILHGEVRDETGAPVPGALIEIWQANAGGRYRHPMDDYLAPLDPNFGGAGRAIADAQGRYVFRTIRPGPYPWPNNRNAWRPAHIHFSLMGASWGQRLITQMYFEGDPLIPHCPIAATIPDRAAIDRLVARLDLAASEPNDSLAYRFDIVLRGRRQTWFESRPEGL